eukprot:11201200-Lingulodinium_polyedra.AAC.1
MTRAPPTRSCLCRQQQQHCRRRRRLAACMVAPRSSNTETTLGELRKPTRAGPQFQRSRVNASRKLRAPVPERFGDVGLDWDNRTRRVLAMATF